MAVFMKYNQPEFKEGGGGISLEEGGRGNFDLYSFLLPPLRMKILVLSLKVQASRSRFSNFCSAHGMHSLEMVHI